MDYIRNRVDMPYLRDANKFRTPGYGCDDMVCRQFGDTCLGTENLTNGLDNLSQPAYNYTIQGQSCPPIRRMDMRASPQVEKGFLTPGEIGRINWKLKSREEMDVIFKIVERVTGKGSRVDRTPLLMDITACHLNGCPLKLVSLLEADDLNFYHDIYGIQHHINRQTGQLEDCFLPRFAA